MDWTSPAPAKLNLCLTITGRRPDGYHNLISLAAFTEFGDSISLAQDRPDGLTITGPFSSALQDDVADNLLMKTKAAVVAAGFSVPEHHICLDKQIPVSSGLGGGSSDVAAYLRCLADMMELDETDKDTLFSLAGQIGADVPVCLRPGFQLMHGTGTDVSPVTVDSQPVFCVLSNPGVPVSTKDVFAALNSPSDHLAGAQPSLSSPLNLKEMLARGNDLHTPAVKTCPEIGQLLTEMKTLADADQLFGMAMSGSGASCFALTKTKGAADHLAGQLDMAGYWAESTNLLLR